MAFIDTDGGQIYYQVAGQGSNWLVLIHGAWASHEWWREQVPILSQEYLVLCFDLRGHGQSSLLPPNFSLPGFVRDLEILFKKIGIQEAGLIGWSLGGIIALEYYLSHPHLIRKLILVASRGKRQLLLKSRIWWSYLRAHLNLMINLSAPRKFNRQEKAFPGERQLLETEIERMFTTPISKQVKEWIRTQLRNYPINNYWQIARDLWEWEINEEKLKNILVPTLIMVGEKDQITPPSLSIFLHQAIPNSRLIVIKEAGHLLPLERPHEVNSHIMEFLGERVN